MNGPTIIVAAYNRVAALSRLLKALDRAHYPNDARLVISIDRGDNAGVVQTAHSFPWRFGEKIIVEQEQHLGLRNHILRCGDLSEQYGAIILLEDDLYVSPEFYNFALHACTFFQDVPDVAGVALYSLHYNETAHLPFEPRPGDCSVFFMQLPCSWGQVWTASQWRAFRAWYNDARDHLVDPQDLGLPENIKGWPQSSWKKYFTMYMVDRNLFFCYPYVSLTTNFCDAGTHYRKATHQWQVPISYATQERYRFCYPGQTLARYDVFCESLAVAEMLDQLDRNELVVDLYGTKPRSCYSRFVLTTRRLNYRVVRRYQLTMRPIEENVMHGIEGEGIFLYDTAVLASSRLSQPPITLEEYFFGKGRSSRLSVRRLWRRAA